MKAKTFFLILFVAICASLAGWWAGKKFSHSPVSSFALEAGGRKIRFYQCSMHRQVKSDKPGKCPICAMDLSPIFEGQGALSENLITLDSSTISVINVQTEVVTQRSLQRTLRVAGTIEDDDTKHRIVSAYIEGRIEKLFVNYVGAQVVQGEPLASFYSPTLLAAEREYSVVAQRAVTNAAGFREEHDRMVAAAALRLKRLGFTDAQIKSLTESGNTPMQTQIVSPMSGTVVSRFAYEGQYVKEGEKLFEIGDFSTMWFRFDAYESDLPFLKVGQKIEVSTPSVPNKMYEAKINFIDPNISDLTRSAKVRVEIANPMPAPGEPNHHALLHRIYAEGVVKLDFPAALVVPRSAVLNAGGDPIVYVEKSAGVYEPRKIKLGSFGDEGWQVISGLNEGERVVTSGNLLIDAQSQFNQGGDSVESEREATLSSTHQNGKPMAANSPLSDTQRQIVAQFFGVADQMAGALAADNFSEFNQQAGKLDVLLPALSKSFASDGERRKLTERIERTGHLPKADTLADARKLFVPFSTAAVELAKTVRIDPAFKSVKIFRCPMADQAVPGSPKNGFWIQTEGGLQNPFFGSAMLDCGSEVKP